jgi:nucleoside-diphosphate-sugar epimerase
VRVLVTGGSGFIGTNLVSLLLKKGYELRSLDIKPPRVQQHGSIFRSVDILDREALSREFTDFAPQVLIHLAARTDLHGRSVHDYAANTQGVVNVLAAVRESLSVGRSIFASSRMVCDISVRPEAEDEYSPPNAYGESKMLGEMLVRSSGLAPADWALVRPTSIWGPWFEVPYRDFFEAVLSGRYIHPKGREVQKSFGYVGNTTYALEKLMLAESSKIHGQTIYLGDYPPVEVWRFASAIRSAAGKGPISVAPIQFLTWVALAGDVLQQLGWKEPPLTRFRLRNLLTDMVLDLNPLESLVGKLPFGMEEGVDITLAWLRSEAAR